MSEVAAEVMRASEILELVAARVFDDHALRGVGDDELVSTLAALGEVSRRAEGLLVAATAEVSTRSPKTAARQERLTTRQGCASVNELVRRSTRVSSSTARALERAGEVTGAEHSIVTGEALPAMLPQLRDALRDGETGIDAITAVARPLRELDERVGSEVRLQADAYLAAVARGESETGEPPACADSLRTVAQALTVYFDPDGSEPRERVAMRKRMLTLIPAAHGLMSLKALLMPETAAQLQRLLDSQLNPAARPEFHPGAAPDAAPNAAPDVARGEGADGDIPAEPVDERSPAQRRHDAFAAALNAAARSGDMPLLGGAVPTLVVTVRESDLASNRGYAQADGVDEPVSLSAARHVACTGVMQRVVQNESGKIVSIETRERVFNAHQRRAILARDGGCIIPGCHVRAAWCEIHHVTEHSEGGATHTDNGVSLCFHHHRTLDVNGWHIRMRGGVPQVLAPEWWDRTRKWRTVTKKRFTPAPESEGARRSRGAKPESSTVGDESAAPNDPPPTPSRWIADPATAWKRTGDTRPAAPKISAAEHASRDDPHIAPRPSHPLKPWTRPSPTPAREDDDEPPNA